MLNSSFKWIRLCFVSLSKFEQSLEWWFNLFFFFFLLLCFINCQSRHIDPQVANFIYKKTYCFLQVKMEANGWVLILREWSKLYFTVPVFPLCTNLLLHALFESLELCPIGLEVLLTLSNVFVCLNLTCFVQLVSHIL